MEIVSDEIFGPVQSVMRFSDLDEAISLANNTQYGLVGAVFSADTKKTQQVVQEMQCGQINVNNYFQMFYDMPFGGYKMSGVGREMGTMGLDNYLETKTVIHDCN